MSASIISSSTARKPATASGPRVAERRPHPVALRLGKLAFQIGARLGQVEVPFTLVACANTAFDEAIVDQGPQHAVEGIAW